MNTTTGSTEPAPRKSLDEIAAMMAENTLKMRGQPETPEEAPDDQPDIVSDEVQPEEGSDEQTASEDNRESVDDAAEDVPSDAASDDEEEQAADTVDAGNTDELEPADDFDMEIDDETMFAIDDNTEVSFKDLREVYQADKTAVELVETQRAAAQEALVTRQKAQEDGERARQAAVAVFQHFENIVATPMVSRPDDSLKRSNPEQYIAHLEAYEADQQRIAEQKNDLATVFDDHLKAQKENKEQLKQQEMQLLFHKVPSLVSNDEATRKSANQDILDATLFYGFKPEEVNEATDHRLYQMAYDAQQYRKIMSKSKASGTDNTEEARKTKVRNQTRTLRPRGTTAKSRMTAKAKRVKAAKATAVKTGKVNDVADFIAASKTSK